MNNGKKAYIASQNIILFGFLEKQLNRLGFRTVRIHNDPDNITEQLKPEETDLLIIDADDSALEGLKDYLEIRRKIDIPVIMVTTTECPRNMIRIFDATTEGYFTEPLEISEIGEWLKVALVLNAKKAG